MNITEMDEDWDWMIQSLKRYKHLHMYELSEPSQVLEWTSSNKIFVADVSSSLNRRYEMLVLSLPSKLSVDPKDQGKLTKDRDFKMAAGGFHHQPVTAMAMVDDSHFVSLSTSTGHDVILWEIKSNEEVIIKQQEFPGQRSSEGTRHRAFVAANPEKSSQVARGSLIANVEVLDVETRKALWSMDCEGDQKNLEIASIDFIDSTNILICDASNGGLHSIDVRSADSNISEAPLENGLDSSSGKTATKGNCHKKLEMVPSETDMGSPVCTWNCSVNFPSRHNRTSGNVGEDDRNRLAAAISADGRVLVYDLRDLSQPMCSAVVSGAQTSQTPCVRWSFTQKNLLSVSGWDNCVRIYDISHFGNTTHGQNSSLAEPVFTYDGHVNESHQGAVWVTNHVWHETSPNLVVSAGNDGSLHAWDWLPT